MLRDPDRMTMEERDAEVAHLLAKALLRIHKSNKKRCKLRSAKRRKAVDTQSLSHKRGSTGSLSSAKTPNTHS